MGESATAALNPAAVYRGRFAPSPTGDLHFGSLIAALASRVDACAHSGDWLVRMEDLDKPREVPGAARALLDTLLAFGCEWSEPVIYQSERAHAYAAAMDQLRGRGLVYPCTCTRSAVERAGRPGPEGPIYPGTCRATSVDGQGPIAWRLRVDLEELTFVDRIQGEQRQRLDEFVGDFVVHRADGIHAYQLAVVVDDAWQGVTQIVRGADLLSSTPRQILLQRLLGLATPSYAHVPLATDALGRKLSKSLAAAPVDVADPLPALRQAWAFLGQRPLGHCASVAEFWRRAQDAWTLALIPPQTVLSVKARDGASDDHPLAPTADAPGQNPARISD